MHVIADPFWVTKSGNDNIEFEDAFCPQGQIDDDTSCIRFAIADGATESSFSKQWAASLTKAYCDGDLTSPRSRRSSRCLRNLRDEWAKDVHSRPLPWYAQLNAERGAHATLAGLTLHENDGPHEQRTWDAIAVGDSCLIQVRGDNLLKTFPINRSTEFNNRPALLSSLSRPDDRVRWRRTRGTWESEDSFYLMTDALACWFLNEFELGNLPWRRLHEIQPLESDFANLIDELRSSQQIHNDDVTMLRIRPN